ncbi:MAG: hypothetical protein WKF58_19245 [Ilumatobacteraceae bacterium]
MLRDRCEIRSATARSDSQAARRRCDVDTLAWYLPYPLRDERRRWNQHRRRTWWSSRSSSRCASYGPDRSGSGRRRGNGRARTVGAALARPERRRSPAIVRSRPADARIGQVTIVYDAERTLSSSRLRVTLA